MQPLQVNILVIHVYIKISINLSYIIMYNKIENIIYHVNIVIIQLLIIKHNKEAKSCYITECLYQYTT